MAIKGIDIEISIVKDKLHKGSSVSFLRFQIHTIALLDSLLKIQDYINELAGTKMAIHIHCKSEQYWCMTVALLLQLLSLLLHVASFVYLENLCSLTL